MFIFILLKKYLKIDKERAQNWESSARMGHCLRMIFAYAFLMFFGWTGGMRCNRLIITFDCKFSLTLVVINRHVQRQLKEFKFKE